MVNRLSISINKDISDRLESLSSKGIKLNISKICQIAIIDTIDLLYRNADMINQLDKIKSIVSDIEALKSKGVIR